MPRYIKVFENVLPIDLCDKLIAKFNKDDRVESDPQPDYSGRTYLYVSDKPDWLELVRKVEPIANDLVLKYFDSINSGLPDWFDDGYVLARYAPGDSLILHDDGQCSDPGRNGLRVATLIFYLNTSPDGATAFPNQDVRVESVQGRALIFPAMLTHPHEVAPVKADRYILQTWITDPGLAVVER